MLDNMIDSIGYEKTCTKQLDGNGDGNSASSRNVVCDNGVDDGGGNMDVIVRTVADIAIDGTELCHNNSSHSITSGQLSSSMSDGALGTGNVSRYRSN